MSDGKTTEVIEADHVVSTLSAKQFGTVLKAADGATAGMLDKFTMQSIVVTNFLFQVRSLPIARKLVQPAAHCSIPPRSTTWKRGSPTQVACMPSHRGHQLAAPGAPRLCTTPRLHVKRG